jgi:hypothetical protein
MRRCALRLLSGLRVTADRVREYENATYRVVAWESALIHDVIFTQPVA